jgi:hypothetical protein
MGFLSAYDGTTRVVIDADRGYWVDLKKYLSQGEREASEKALSGKLTVVNGKTNVSPDFTVYRESLILASISAWNLDDDNGVVWPITAENVRKLPGDVYDQLWSKIDNMAETRKGDDQIRFRDGNIGGNSDGDGGSAVS